MIEKSATQFDGINRPLKIHHTRFRVFCSAPVPELLGRKQHGKVASFVLKVPKMEVRLM